MDLSIYVHIPFCIKKCLYCDFLSFSGDKKLQESYVNALIREIKGFPNKADYRIRSVFIGGGTPSCIDERYIEEIMRVIFKEFNVCADAEITIEANPGTITINKARSYISSGINRVSMGLQAVQDDLLYKLGRIHTFSEFKQSYDILRDVGFNNINVDLMFALPYQSMEQWRECLNTVIEMKPEHISCYSLIIEEGTPFYDMAQEDRGFATDEDNDRQMYYLAKEILGENGYGQYEISNFAKDGFYSRHNCVYWQRGQYIGFGLGASSLLNDERFKNSEDIQAYIAGSHYEQIEKIEGRTAYGEFMFLGLRMTEGVRISDFKASFGVDIFDVYGKEIARFAKEGLLIVDEDRIRLSDKGVDVSNSVFVEFI